MRTASYRNSWRGLPSGTRAPRRIDLRIAVRNLKSSSEAIVFDLVQPCEEPPPEPSTELLLKARGHRLRRCRRLARHGPAVSGQRRAGTCPFVARAIVTHQTKTPP